MQEASPSSRRAWIEIRWRRLRYCRESVALLAEGVDRNPRWQLRNHDAPPSPSSRRAWIEIALGDDVDDSDYVALLTEGVDRNIREQFKAMEERGRPPHGGRG